MLRFIMLAVMASIAMPVMAQEDPIKITTVTRAPFSMVENDADIGFSVELWQMLAADLGRRTEFDRADTFAEMLDRVKNGEADGAIANISITAERETALDFSQPIFNSGLQIMLPLEKSGSSVLGALFTRDIAVAVLIAIGLLFGGGMLMWLFERRRQPYFDRPAKEAVFPAFWWALNLVVNGGFEERMPISRAGRFFAVVLVVASLFIVSVFVAKITAAMTVDALQNSVTSVNDLEDRRVGTLQDSTAALYLDQREINYITFANVENAFAAFEAKTLDAIFFDGPILSYYVRTRGAGKARMVQRVFKPENYGMALPSGSPLREPINRALLQMREDGRYDSLRTKWFGSQR
ncbi:transporter substrate-binding domain-containing protein [uncultured Litoreibacter sp.]|uniref:transporter substrate-binding domain-containing protein n=1 Tax=uncultured Litoreibacter sp. TaxID=1392394 RepID=UPI00260E493C|nr:transporter substrate-binding domain-containing protein [uncultured Litoreibacter sp.]